MCERKAGGRTTWPSQCNVFCDVAFEAAQTLPLLDLKRADVQQCWTEPAHHSMSCLSIGIRKFCFEMLAWLKMICLFNYLLCTVNTYNFNNIYDKTNTKIAHLMLLKCYQKKYFRVQTYTFIHIDVNCICQIDIVAFYVRYKCQLILLIRAPHR